MYSSTTSKNLHVRIKSHIKVPKQVTLFIHTSGRVIHENNEELSSLISPGKYILTVTTRLLGGGPKKDYTYSGDNPTTSTHSTSEHIQSNNTVVPPCVKFYLDADNSAVSWLAIHKQWLKAAGYTTQSTQAHNLLSHIPTDNCKNINNILDILQSEKAYDELVKAIINFTNSSQQEVILKYFKANQLGNQTPSDYLRKAKTELTYINPTLTQEDNLLKQLFIQSLPANIQLLLTAIPPTLSLTEIANVADKSFEVLKQNCPSPVITASIASQQSEIANLQETTKRLNDTITQLTASLNQISLTRQRSTHRRFNRSPSRTRSTSRGMTCYYHRKFRNDARRCFIGCKYYTPSFNSNKCIYHATFDKGAHRCLTGCKWNQSNSTDNNQQLYRNDNHPKN